MDEGSAWPVTIDVIQIAYRHRKEAITSRHYDHYWYRHNRRLIVGGGKSHRHPGTNPADCNGPLARKNVPGRRVTPITGEYRGTAGHMLPVRLGEWSGAPSAARSQYGMLRLLFVLDSRT